MGYDVKGYTSRNGNPMEIDGLRGQYNYNSFVNLLDYDKLPKVKSGCKYSKGICRSW